MAHENVRLVQVDGKLPNLALMKLAHWHKSIGNRVTLSRTVQPSLFEQATYHRVYGSAIFTRSRGKLDELLTAYPDAVVGGTGSRRWTYRSRLKLELRNTSTTTMGFTRATPGASVSHNAGAASAVAFAWSPQRKASPGR